MKKVIVIGDITQTLRDQLGPSADICPVPSYDSDEWKKAVVVAEGKHGSAEALRVLGKLRKWRDEKNDKSAPPLLVLVDAPPPWWWWWPLRCRRGLASLTIVRMVETDHVRRWSKALGVAYPSVVESIKRVI